MYSNFDKEEFFETLRLNTKIGNPLLKLSPFGAIQAISDTAPDSEYSKIYFGTFDEKSFLVTLNFFFYPNTKFTIRGDYYEKDGRLAVEFEVGHTDKFNSFMNRYAPFILLAVVNFAMLADGEVPFLVPVFFDFCVLCAFFVMRWKDRRARRRLEKEFVKNFQLQE